MLTIACCLAVGLRLGVRLGSDLVSAWLVGSRAHLYVLLSVVIVTTPRAMSVTHNVVQEKYAACGAM